MHQPGESPDTPAEKPPVRRDPAHGEVVDAVGVLVVADVDPESPLGATPFFSAEHSHRGIVGPQDRRSQHQALLQLGQRFEQERGVADPVAQGAPRQIYAVSRQDIFESIKREMVGELADDHERDQTGSGDPARYRLGRYRRAGHAVAAFRAGVLGQDMDLDLHPRRDELELARLVLADAGFRLSAARTRLLT